MPAYTPATETQTRALINQYIIDNDVNTISPARIRAILQTIVDYAVSLRGESVIKTNSSLTLDNTCADMYVMDATSANITITLPPYATCYNGTNKIGRVLHFKRRDSSGHTATISPVSGEFIDYTLTTQALASLGKFSVIATSEGWLIR